MKRRVSLLLAVVMILGSFSVVFADAPTRVVTAEEAGKFLQEQGILVGKPGGDLDLKGKFVRQDTMIVLARLYNEFEEAKTHDVASAKKFKDITIKGYRPYIAWAVDKGLIVGTSATTFGFNQELRAGDFARMLTNILGYEGINSKEAFVKAGELGILRGTDLKDWKNNTNRGQMAQMVYNVLANKVDGGKGDYLANVLGIEDYPGLELTIAKVEELKDITVKLGEEIELPKTVEVTLSDETQREVKIDWDITELDVNKVGEYELEGKLSTADVDLPETDLKAKVKVIVVGELVLADKVEANNETEVKITFNEKEDIKEADLKDKEIKLNEDIVAKYITNSLTAKEARFKLVDHKLEDAKTYEVMADWMNLENNKFIAKLKAPYIAEFEKVTETIPAKLLDKDGQPLAKKDAQDKTIQIAAKDQYGQAIKLEGAKVVKATLETMPVELTLKEDLIIVPGKLNLREGQVLKIDLIANEAKENEVKGSLEYKIAKPQELKVTSMELKSDKEVIKYGEEVKFTADARDQFNSPMKATFRWTLDGVVVETENTEGTFTKKFEEPGKFLVKVFDFNNPNVNAEKTVSVAAADLKTLTFNKLTDTNKNAILEALGMKENGQYNKEDVVLGTLESNKGAELVAENIKFNVKAVDKDLDEKDIKVEAKEIEYGENKTKAIVLIAKTQKAGQFEIISYVGDKLEDAIKTNTVTHKTTIDPNVAEVSSFNFDSKELKVGAENVKAEVVFKNKHGEVLTADQVNKEGTKVKVTSTNGKATGDVTIVQGTKENKDEDKTYINLVGVIEAGKAEVSILLDSITKARQAIEVKEAKLTSIKIDSDSIVKVRAGKTIYLPLSVKDQDGVEMIDESKVKVVIEGEEVKSEPKTTENATISVVAKQLDENGNVDETKEKALYVKVVAGNQTTTENIKFHVEANDNSEVKSNAVEVSVIEEAKPTKVELEKTKIKLDVGNSGVVKLAIKDQDGNLIDKDNTVTASVKENLIVDNKPAAPETKAAEDKEINLTEVTEDKDFNYEVELEAKKAGETKVEFKISDKVVASLDVEVVVAEDKVDAIEIKPVDHMIKVKADADTKAKAGEAEEAVDRSKVDLEVIGKIGQETINIANNKIEFTSLTPEIATVEEGKVTGEKAGKAKIQAKLNTHTAIIEIEVSDKAPVIQKDSLKLLVEDKEVKELVLDGVDTLKVTVQGKDQYGVKVEDDATLLKGMKINNTAIAEAGAAQEATNVVIITAQADGETNLYIETSDNGIEIPVKVKNYKEKSILNKDQQKAVKEFLTEENIDKLELSNEDKELLKKPFED